MNSIGLQLAIACGTELIPASGLAARVANGQSIAVVGYVYLPTVVATVCKDVRVAIMSDLDTECYLGVNFIKKFRAVLDPKDNTLHLKDDVSVKLEVDSISGNNTVFVSAIGLADPTEEQRKEAEALIAQLIGNGLPPLGCTSWVEHAIDVSSTRLIKQKYYPVSQKLEEEMHKQVEEMLGAGIIEPLTSGWSSPVVMVRKSKEKFRFCVDFRIVNAASKPAAYPLRYMESILCKLQTARYISTLDSSCAYHERDDGLHRARQRAIQIYENALRSFVRRSVLRRLIDKVIRPELKAFAYSYLEGITIVTETFEEHEEVLK